MKFFRVPTLEERPGGVLTLGVSQTHFMLR